MRNVGIKYHVPFLLSLLSEPIQNYYFFRTIKIYNFIRIHTQVRESSFHLHQIKTVLQDFTHYNLCVLVNKLLL